LDHQGGAQELRCGYNSGTSPKRLFPASPSRLPDRRTGRAASREREGLDRLHTIRCRLSGGACWSFGAIVKDTTIGRYWRTISCGACFHAALPREINHRRVGPRSAQAGYANSRIRLALRLAACFVANGPIRARCATLPRGKKSQSAASCGLPAIEGGTEGKNGRGCCSTGEDLGEGCLNDSTAQRITVPNP